MIRGRTTCTGAHPRPTADSTRGAQRGRLPALRGGVRTGCRRRPPAGRGRSPTAGSGSAGSASTAMRPGADPVRTPPRSVRAWRRNGSTPGRSTAPRSPGSCSCDRQRLAPLAAVEHLVGMQAQCPNSPYVGLWSRLTDFDPDVLGRLITGREAVRAPLMRCTLHLASAADCLALRPVVQAVFERTYRATSEFARQVADEDLDAVESGRGGVAGRATADPGRAGAAAGRALAGPRPGRPRVRRDLPGAAGAGPAARRVGGDRPVGVGPGRVVARTGRWRPTRHRTGRWSATWPRSDRRA